MFVSETEKEYQQTYGCENENDFINASEINPFQHIFNLKLKTTLQKSKNAGEKKKC